MRDNDDGSDVDAARRYRRRLKKQRIYQETYRERQAAVHRPDREQMAAAFLTMVVRLSARNWESGAKWLAHISREMSGDFDQAQVEAAFIGMVKRERKRLKPRHDDGGGNA